uniref:Uncharacterized protein n=1 Tax=Siphoviridae sp. ctZHD14 TaxID=2827891 RepID=A0A8S5SW93_9CAUD|nr:MAG TPA: hypothetical protein [Siphoviridae sp. ctZHD14]
MPHPLKNAIVYHENLSKNFRNSWCLFHRKRQ